MTRIRSFGAIALATPLLVAALAAPGLAAWTTDGVPISSSGNRGSEFVHLFPDGAGGVLVGWIEREGQIYAPVPFFARLDASGNLAAASSTQLPSEPLYASFAPDGAGGMFRGWFENFNQAVVRAQHVLPTGALDPQWDPQGDSLSTRAGQQGWVRVAPDGSGGVYGAWFDGIDSPPTLHVQRLDATSARATGWPAHGIAALQIPGGSVPLSSAAIASDVLPIAGGGVFVTAVDATAYAQRLTGSGSIAPGWTAGGLKLGDHSGDWRARPGLLRSLAGDVLCVWKRGPLPVVGTGIAPGAIVVQRFTAAGAIAAGWPAAGVFAFDTADSLTAPVAVSDSAGGAFLVWALKEVASGAWSVRALHVLADGSRAPGWPAAGLNVMGGAGEFVPVGFGASADGVGGVLVAWDDARDHLAYPRVYATRVLGNAALAPGWPAGGTAVDPPALTGNLRAILGDGAGGAFVAWRRRTSVVCPCTPFGELRVSRMTASGTVAVPAPPTDTPSLDFALRRVAPNPAGDVARVSFALAPGTRGVLELLDLAGRRVRRIELEAGRAGEATLDGLSRLPAGLYVVRLAQAGRVRTTRLVLTR